MRHRIFIKTAFLIAVSAAPLIAHHSVAKVYDANKATAIQGVITKVEWMNPHVWISMDVKSTNGRLTSWRVEIKPPNALFRAGITKDLFELNKTYSMTIWPAFDGSKVASGRSLTFPDGRTIDVSDNWGQGILFP